MLVPLVVEFTTNPGLFGKGAFVGAKSGAKQLSWPLPSFLFAIGVRSLVPQQSRDRLQRLFVTDIRSDDLEAQYSVEVPGYAAVRMTVHMAPVVDSLLDIAVPLEPIAETHWCTLDVRLVTTPAARAAAASLDPDAHVGTVGLFAGSREVCSFAIDASHLAHGRTLRGVPSGEYDFVFETTEGYYQAPTQHLKLLGGGNVLDFDVSSAGSLELVVLDSGSAPYDGPLRTSITVSDGSVFHSAFASSPYVFPLLSPGTYTVRELQLAGSARTVGPASAVVEAGVRSVLRIVPE